MWPEAGAVRRSSSVRARRKVLWQIFENILGDAVRLAYELWPDDPRYLWHGMSVFATDGSKYNLPATDDIRKEFDSRSGLRNNGKGHYPQCLVSTLYDVLRHLPVARTVAGVNSSEREEAKNLLPYLPDNSVWLSDRGYPAYELFLYLKENYSGYFAFRSPASHTFPAVESFIKSGREESIIHIRPSKKYVEKLGAKERGKLRAVKLRVVRLVSPDGTVSVVLTNLIKKKRFPKDEIINPYFERCRIEEYYRDEKIVLETDRFHSKKINGIFQELFAAMIMTVISGTLMVSASVLSHLPAYEFQFKNAIMTVAAEAFFLVPCDSERAVRIFDEVLSEISRVRYYHSKIPRSPQPRVSKKPVNKWSVNKLKKIA